MIDPCEAAFLVYILAGVGGLFYLSHRLNRPTKPER